MHQETILYIPKYYYIVCIHLYDSHKETNLLIKLHIS